ncbi:hypothetical protein U1Q18_047537 [Sarracenia purpurea var. burkii]
MLTLGNTSNSNNSAEASLPISTNQMENTAEEPTSITTPGSNTKEKEKLRLFRPKRVRSTEAATTGLLAYRKNESLPDDDQFVHFVRSCSSR